MIEALRQTTVSREYADAVIQGMMGVLIVTDADSRMVTVNRAACELLNYEETDLMGKPVDMLFARQGNPFKMDRLQDPSASQPRTPMETALRTKSAEDVPVLMSASVLLDNEGRLSRVVYVGKDITEWKRAEAALRESEDRYRDMVESSQALLCTHELEGRILFANQWAADHLKYGRQALLTMTIQDILTPEARDLYDQYISQVKKHGSARGLMRVRTADGEDRIWEYHNSLRTEGISKPIVRGMAWDVTEQKRLEKEREQLVQDLQKALSEVKTLSGLLPICSACKKIRDDKGYWSQIEAYVHQHTNAEFTHSICPTCMKKTLSGVL